MVLKSIMRCILLCAIIAATVAGCGNGGGSSSGGPVSQQTPTWLGTLITSQSVSPITAFTQNVVSQDTGTYNEAFPGEANIWSLYEDFSLGDGFDKQFNFALAMSVSSASTSTDFPLNQDYNELTFYTPVLGSGDGVKVAAVSDGSTVFSSLPSSVSTVMTGTSCAFLNATSNSRLQQTLDLSSQGTPTRIDISWDDAVSLDMGAIFGYIPDYQVVVRSESTGAVLKVLYTSPADYLPHSHILANALTQFSGQKIVLSFEVGSSNTPQGTTLGTSPVSSQAYAIFDAVSVKDFPGFNEYVTNGGFESGMSGWTTNTPVEVQNLTSGSRTLEGLKVTRSFYTVPNKLWARWVDVFENTLTSAVTRTVTYQTCLGSDENFCSAIPATPAANVIYYTPGTGNKALTSWSEVGARDVGLVFGNAQSKSFTSDDGTKTTGRGLVEIAYSITVPAGGRVAIVNFVLMDGIDTGLTAANTSAKATAIDTEAKNIVDNFWTDVQYRTGMTQQQIDAVSNF